MTERRASWTVGKRIKDRPRVNLYCFPHSGGLAGEYVRWGGHLPGVQVRGMSLPGRGPRLAEPALTDLGPLVGSLVDDTEFEPPFVLFGHSLGALLAFETARELRERGRPQPERLIVSAHSAPSVPRGRSDWHTLPDGELLEVLTDSYDGIPSEIAADSDVIALVLPALRADLALLEGYDYRPGEPLGMPVDAFVADGDVVTVGQVEPWGDLTTGEFTIHHFPGRHFYFREFPIHSALEALLGRDDLA
ncbi:thioesterase II family protein [Umezawaea sp. NPDC059074]|uniref:thioesterase II family protein n=1 Tax=Umezawaea sp. NPDC059074 TaxID=3346716 RepID=UPI003679B0A7